MNVKDFIIFAYYTYASTKTAIAENFFIMKLHQN